MWIRWRDRERGRKKKTSFVFLRDRVLLFPLGLSVLFLYISSGVKQEGAAVIHNLIKRCGQKPSFKYNLWTLEAFTDRQIHTPCFPFTSAPSNTWFGCYCATAVSDKSCFLSTLYCEFKKRRKKKKTEKNTLTLFGPTVRDILWLLSLINKHMANWRQQSILRGERSFTVRKKSQRTNLGVASLGDLLRWGNRVNFEFVSGVREECSDAIWTRLWTNVVVGAECGRAWL